MKNNLSSKVVENINGVRVVRVGRVCYDNRGRKHEILECSVDGNEWYSNYSNNAEALKVQDELSNRGVDTVIGPEAPYMIGDEYIIKGNGRVGLYRARSRKKEK